MALFEALSNVLSQLPAFFHLESPLLLLWIIPLFFALRYVLKTDFIKLKEEEEHKHRRLLVQKVMVVTRTAIFLLILIALASPFMQRERIIEGDMFLKILIDNSTSMSVLESIPQNLISELEKRTSVEVKTIGSAEDSYLGDDLLNTLEPYESVLLITDGHATKGANIGDVVFFSTKLNSTINALLLKEDKSDVAISVSGPSKTMSEVENTFTVNLNRVGKMKGTSVPLSIKLDGAVIFSGDITSDKYEFSKSLSEGFHTITAQTNIADVFSQNNVFYKTINVVSQPKVLFYTSKPDSPLVKLYKQVVDVKTTSGLPSSTEDVKRMLDDYYAIIVNDIHAKDLNSRSEALQEYLQDGNGMLVFGGYNSYGDGLYKNSLFESLLPVFVGKAGRKESDVNVVILVDISGSTQTSTASGASVVDVEKSLALTVLKTLRPNIKLGVLAFNTQAYVVSEFSYLFSKSDVEDKISRLYHVGGTLISTGLLKAISMLDQAPGSKNIILISDGKTHDSSTTMDAAKLAANKGIKIYAIGVGPKTSDSTMMQIAEIGNGAYFKVEDVAKIKILFGEIEEQGAKIPGLSILNSNHFITQDLKDIEASVHGFTDVVPKTSARLLVTTTNGDPVLTVWRVGLGRVGAFSTDDGSVWASELLGEKNSKLLVRSLNWAVGEPDRKAKKGINVEDTRINQPTTITIRAEEQPISKEYTFYKIDENTYSTTVTPSATGFVNVLNGIFASNYPLEYQFLGINPELGAVVGATNGKLFKLEEENVVDNIIDQVQSRSKRVVSGREIVRWPFVLAALILFLAEIFMRRWLRSE